MILQVETKEFTDGTQYEVKVDSDKTFRKFFASFPLGGFPVITMASPQHYVLTVVSADV